MHAIWHSWSTFGILRIYQRYWYWEFTSATGTETFCFTSLDDIAVSYQADVGGYSFLLDREQNLQQGAAGDQHWREENQKTVARLLVF